MHIFYPVAAIVIFCFFARCTSQSAINGDDDASLGHPSIHHDTEPENPTESKTLLESFIQLQNGPILSFPLETQQTNPSPTSIPNYIMSNHSGDNIAPDDRYKNQSETKCVGCEHSNQGSEDTNSTNNANYSLQYPSTHTAPQPRDSSMKTVQSPSSIEDSQAKPNDQSEQLPIDVFPPNRRPSLDTDSAKSLQTFPSNENQNSTLPIAIREIDTPTSGLSHPIALNGPAAAIQLHYLRRWASSWNVPITGSITVGTQIPSQNDILSSTFEDPEFACDLSDSRNAIIYCQGELLHAVMMLHLFNDSKTFVDKPLKMDPDRIVANFKERFPNTITRQHRDAIRAFIDEHFYDEGNELEECDLIDWDEQPHKLLTIEDPALREFALKINSIWKKLCRTIKKEVSEQPERFSLLYVPNEFVIPGGRFREFYYWDTYWVVKGLLASGMHETTKRMITNFQHLIERNGFIPNGGRIYYMRRSQPPMFIPMIYEYHTATKDDEFLMNAIEAMEKEMEFWKKKRTVNIFKNDRNYTVFRYRADSNVPRPESYREDYETAEKVSIERRRRLWRDIASAAESGWDFSSRWMADRQTMHTIETSDIAPVDLNAFMCWNMAILAHLHGRLGNHTRRAELFRERNEFVDTFTEVFFDKREGVWFDVRVHNGEWAQDAYPSVAAPLFTECYHRLDARMMIDVLDTLERYGYLGFPGGIPTSLKKGTNQQWDYPNGWAPINHMIIEGLRKSSHYSMQQRAFEIASKWIDMNYQAYKKDNKMWEKYDVTQEDVTDANGGEYDNQAGFGWTNGVALDLMVTYGKLLRLRKPSSTPSPFREDFWTSSAGFSLSDSIMRIRRFFTFALLFMIILL